MAAAGAVVAAEATSAVGGEVLLLLTREEPRPTREERELRMEAAAEEDLECDRWLQLGTSVHDGCTPESRDRKSR